MEQGFEIGMLGLTLAGSIGSIGLLLGEKYLKKYLVPKFHYLLWLGVLLLFVVPIPFNITLQVPQGAYTQQEVIQINEELNQITQLESEQQNHQVVRAKGKLVDGIAWVWFFCAFGSAIWTLSGYNSFRKRIILSECVPSASVYQIYLETCKEEGIKRPIALLETEGIDTPMIFGLLHPKLYLPKGYRLERQALVYVFLHELTHYRRGHLIGKWLGMAVQWVHWFNPLVYLVSRRFGQTCEWACDAEVVKGLQERERKYYIRTIIEIVSQGLGINPLSTCMGMSKELLAQRFGHILKGDLAVKNYGRKAFGIWCSIGSLVVIIASVNLVGVIPIYQGDVVVESRPIDEARVRTFLHLNYPGYPVEEGYKRMIENGKVVVYEVEKETILHGNLMTLSRYEEGVMRERMRYKVTDYSVELLSSTRIADFLKVAKEEVLRNYKAKQQILVAYEVESIQEIGGRVQVSVRSVGEGCEGECVESYTINLRKNKFGEYEQMVVVF
ncbi:MAG: M56 family metallopeptidase [Cellulosilyticaceae bacterium]